MADYEIADLSLADAGRNKINWNEGDMPVLLGIRERFRKERPLAGLRISVCLHITAKTAALMRTLSAGGAEVVLVASNPLSTQDDVLDWNKSSWYNTPEKQYANLTSLRLLPPAVRTSFATKTSK